MLIRFFLLLSMIFSNLTISESLYKFDSAEDEKRFYSLIKEIRCPKCTSGSLASSNAPVSEDIKLYIYNPTSIIELISNSHVNIF